MRTLALDIGGARIGVALSDAAGRVATPLTCLDARALERDLGPLREIVKEWGVERVVVGLPLSLDGTEGPQAELVRRQARRIEAGLRVPVELVDERLTTVEAARRLREAGVRQKRRRGATDMAAATLVLQAYLDARRGERSASVDVEPGPGEVP